MHTNLPNNRETSDHELDAYGYDHIPGYRGAINRNDFPRAIKKMAPGDSCVINLDPEWKHGGSHWTAVRLSSEAPIVLYVDSFGAPPPTPVTKAARRAGLGVLYADTQRQDLNEVNCGPRSLLALQQLHKGAESGMELETFERMA